MVPSTYGFPSSIGGRLAQRLAKNNHNGSGGDQSAADDGRSSELFTQQQPREKHDERHAEFVERGNARRRTHLKCAEVAKPRKARRKPRQRKKQDSAAVE